MDKKKHQSWERLPNGYLSRTQFVIMSDLPIMGSRCQSERYLDHPVQDSLFTLNDTATAGSKCLLR